MLTIEIPGPPCLLLSSACRVVTQWYTHQDLSAFVAQFEKAVHVVSSMAVSVFVANLWIGSLAHLERLLPATAGISDGNLLALAASLPQLRMLHVDMCRHLSRDGWEAAKRFAAIS